MPRQISRTLRWLPVALIMLLVLLWDWNWFRPLLERAASSALGRPVTIEALAVRLSAHPHIALTGLQIHNPEDFPAEMAPLFRAEQLELVISLRALLDRQVQLEQIRLASPVATLHQNSAGVRNWQFEPSTEEPAVNPWSVEIHQLEITDGRFALRDSPLQADLTGQLHTEQASDGEPRLVARAEGRYGQLPLTAQFRGGSALRLRQPENPYPVDLQVRSGETRLWLQGQLLDPIHFREADLRLRIEGKDLAALSALAPVPLPQTPPYRLEGDFDYQARQVALRHFKGQVGESDMAGDLALRWRPSRPLLEAKVHSRRLRLVDLSGLIGADPNQVLAQEKASPNERVLPQQPIQVPRLQQADVRFDFTGEEIVSEHLPFQRLAFALRLDDGILQVAPADFGIGEGVLRIHAQLDPRGDTLGLDAQAELRRVDLSALMAKTGYRGNGRLGGTAQLRGKGRSAAELLGNGEGGLKLAMVGGDFSALLLDLAGFDFGNAALRLIGTTPRTEVRCLVGDFSLTAGQLRTESFVLDTGTTNLLLDGGANFRDETLALRLSTQPKRANIGRLKAPIHIGGTFAQPRIRPDYVDLGVRSAAAIALGTLLTPLAAVLPTLQLGPGEDRDCKALQSQAEIRAPQPPKAR